MVEPNAGSRKKWHCGTPVLTQKNHLLGRAKGKGGSSMAPLSGKQEPVTAFLFVLFLHYMLLLLMPQKSGNISVHLHFCQRKAHPAWQPGAISIGNTNWCFPDRKHSKKERYEQCRAYQPRLLCFTAPATAAKL